ncbi:MAG TPA: transglutaminase family protein [Methylocystis sp.]|nr:transglutaminase family protein [Methylocystis sp.]
MRLRIRHRSIYRYETPPRGAIVKLRLTPRACASQSIESWRIEICRDCRLEQSEDAFGNIVHCFSVDGPLDRLTTVVEGEVETFETSGVLRGAVERLPPALFLRETPLTAPSERVRAFAQEVAAPRGDALSRLHELLASIFAVMTFDADSIRAATSAAEAFEEKRGGAQDSAHLFIACARALEIPARYVSGYLWRVDAITEQTAGHAWAEAFVEGLGWVGFDPSHGVSPDEAYVRVAAALDCLGAAPIRGAHFGGGGEALDVSVNVSSPAAQAQSQSQA